MNKKLLLAVFSAILLSAALFAFGRQSTNDNFISTEVDPQKQDIRLYWKDDKDALIRRLGRLKEWLATKNQKLVFAMNGGMYKEDNSPCGLFIQDSKQITRLNTSSGTANFYLKPNGVFYIKKNKKAFISKTEAFTNSGDIAYATQSGPMLVIDGKIHPSFKAGSNNTNIRNGVGILPDGKVLFALSKKQVNLYDFAQYFLRHGCKNALYLDGFVSRAYLPEKNWIQTDGNFGVIIGVTK